MRSLLFFVLFIGFMPSASIAEEVVEGSLSAADKAAVVKALEVSLEQNYVHQAKVRRIASHFKKQLRSGQLDDANSPQEFADALTEQLVDISQDFHFFVAYDPEWIAQSKALSDEGEGLGLREDQIGSLQQFNFGFKKLEVLEGNVGYMRFDFFPDPKLSFEAGATAMRFVENTDALIIDLRYNRGGHNEFAQFLSSYLFDGSEPQLLHEYSYRSDGETITGTHHTMPALPGPRKPNVPVYVLTSTTTFSAGEWFAYALQKLGRAEIVGKQTSGASHSVDRKAIDDQFLLQVPVGVGRDPVEKSDFEGVGVKPDHEVASFTARAVAHKLALSELAKGSPETQAQFDWLAPVLDARISQTSIEADQLNKFVGQYEGRSIELNNGSLLYRWRDRFSLSLIPLQESLFAIEGVDDFRFRFVEQDGQVTTLERLESDGRVIVYPRK